MKKTLGIGTRFFVMLILLSLPAQGTAATPLSGIDLAQRGGADTSFWKDPCTWDGVAVGAGVAFLAGGNPSGFITAALGLWKAVKMDDCF